MYWGLEVWLQILLTSKSDGDKYSSSLVARFTHKESDFGKLFTYGLFNYTVSSSCYVMLETGGPWLVNLKRKSMRQIPSICLEVHWMGVS
jgi:hypothetical protein